MRIASIALPFAGSCLCAEPKVERLATGFRFTEGPALALDGSVYFTEIFTRRTYRWLQAGEVGEVVLFQEENGQANGLAFDTDGNLFICEQHTRRISKLTSDGDLVKLIDTFEGKKLNSPNDLFLSPNGGIYFTDPRFTNRESMELDHESVYFLNSRGLLALAADGLVRPNGIVGTPCGKWLYVGDQSDRKTFRYRVANNGSLSGRMLFADQGSDGMAIDSKGNLYLTDEGVDIYSPEGEHLKSVRLPEKPTNVAILSESPVVIFVTARASIFRVIIER
ncbi:gnl [Symbiodinium natans]|uniref:Gnl protein n=1 Tax=Symbiodinium natans TaxID=878477 RepID=A0A812KAC9_9DINO|nr:gnl [Symbiodinium natans]